MSSVSSLQSCPSRVSVPDTPDAGDTKSVIDSGLKLPIYHSKFYIQEELMVTFLVENHLFRIHHYFLVRESDKFRSIIMRRESADAAIPLSDVTCLEFECLLEFFYNGMHEEYDPNIDEWLALLSISTNYGMDKIRQRVISQLDNQPEHMDPVDKIVLAERHGIDKWLAPAYAALCQRAEPLQFCEAERLGLQTTVKLARARELHRETGDRPRPDFDIPSTQTTRTTAVVNEVFWGTPEDTLAGTKGKKKKGGW